MLGCFLPAKQQKGSGRTDGPVTGKPHADGSKECQARCSGAFKVRKSSRFFDRMKALLKTKAHQALNVVADTLHEPMKDPKWECKPIAAQVELLVDTRPAQPVYRDESLLPLALAHVVDHLSAEVQNLQQTRQSLEVSMEGLREEVGSLTEQRDRAVAQAQVLQQQLEALLLEREEEEIYTCACAMFTQVETCIAAEAAPHPQPLPIEAAVPEAAQSAAVSSQLISPLQSGPLEAMAAFFPGLSSASPAPAQLEAPTAVSTEDDVTSAPAAAANLPAAPSGPIDAAPAGFMAALFPLPSSSPASPPAATAAPVIALPQDAAEPEAAAQDPSTGPGPPNMMAALFPGLLSACPEPAPGASGVATMQEMTQASVLQQAMEVQAAAVPSSPAASTARMLAAVSPLLSAAPARQAHTAAPSQQAAAPLPFAGFGAFFSTPASETSAESIALPSTQPDPEPASMPALPVGAALPHPCFAHLAGLFPTPTEAAPSSCATPAAAPTSSPTGGADLLATPRPTEPVETPLLGASAPMPAFADLFPAPAVQPSSLEQDAYAPPPFADMFPTPAAQPSSPEQEASAPPPFADMFPGPAFQPSSSEQEGSEATASGYHPHSPPASAADYPQEAWRQYEDLLDGREEEEEYQPAVGEQQRGSTADVAQLRREVKDLRRDKTRLQGQLRAAVPISSVDPSEVTISMKRQRTAEGIVEVVPRKLGRGGFGVVYHAHHEQFGFVAYKELKARSDDEDDDFGLSRLEPEAEMMACVPHHRNVMPLLARVVDVTGYLQGLLMPLCEGGSARRLLQPETPEPAILAAAEDGARGLAYLHDQDVVHCDVKLDNLLLQAGPDGTGPALLADFGTAVRIDEATRKARMSGCTKHLCSPELHSMLEECKAAKEAACEAGELELSVPAPQVGREEDTWQYGLAVLALATRDARIVRGSGPDSRLTDAELEAALERADAACPLLAEAARMCLERDGGARAPMQDVAAHLAAARARDAELAAASEDMDVDLTVESCTDSTC